MQDQETQPVKLTEDEVRLFAIEQAMEELRRERDSVVDKLKTLTRQRDDLYASVEAQKAIENMTAAQKNALSQVLGVGSIAPTNTVSSPGEIRNQ